MSALAHHAATDVYESTDDYDQTEIVETPTSMIGRRIAKHTQMTKMDLN